MHKRRVQVRGSEGPQERPVHLKGPRERIEWRRALKLMLSGGVVDVQDVEDLDMMVVDE